MSTRIGRRLCIMYYKDILGEIDVFYHASEPDVVRISALRTSVLCL